MRGRATLTAENHNKINLFSRLPPFWRVHYINFHVPRRTRPPPSFRHLNKNISSRKDSNSIKNTASSKASFTFPNKKEISVMPPKKATATTAKSTTTKKSSAPAAHASYKGESLITQRRSWSPLMPGVMHSIVMLTGFYRYDQRCHS